MKKILITLLFIISSSIYAFANEANKTPLSQTTKTEKNSAANVEDPDLKLSIEELRKKYPIDWLEKKYGNINLCPDLDDPEPINLPKHLVCNFQSQKHSFDKFSGFEIRSVFVNIKTDDYDFRVEQIARIVLEYFEHKTENSLTYEEKNLRRFIYSDRIITPFKNLGDCITIRKVRYNCASSKKLTNQ